MTNEAKLILKEKMNSAKKSYVTRLRDDLFFQLDRIIEDSEPEKENPLELPLSNEKFKKYQKTRFPMFII